MCSRVLWNDKEKVATARVGGRKVPLAVVGRVMDWAFDEYKADLWILPPGGKRDGRTKLNPIRWPIKYGSLVVPVSWPVMRNGKQVEVATSTDGINQKGLAGHTLWLGRTKYPELDGTKPTLNIAIWLQYYLDQFATVEEALKDAKKRRFHLVPVPIGKIGGKLHLTLEDRSGSSAVIEYVDGEQHAHKGPGYSVVTNSLSCDMQRDADYEEYKEQFQRGRIRLPTTTNSNHRFVRAKHYLEHLPKATDERETVAYLMSVLRNVSYPFGGSDPLVPQDEAIPSTRWRSAINLPQSVYYFESTTRPNIFWVVISDLKFGTFQKLDLPGRPDPVGNVASQFAEVPESFAWPEPEDVVPAEALHSAGRQVEKLLIIGGGPKAAAVCAKCCILRDLDLPAPKPVVFEQHVLAAAWTGRHGYTTGTLRLGTSPEKDVGFPYFEDSKNAQVTSELFRRFSWTNYLRKLGTFAEWIDRGRPHPTHKQYSDYISWVITNSIQKDEKIIGTVQEIHPQNGGWRVVVQIGDQRKEFEGDKLLVTGTGKAKRPEFEFPRDKNILFGDNFWTEENLKLLDAVREDSDPIAIVGGGETAASIAEYLTEKLGPRRIPIIIITRNGTIFSRGEGYYENRVFTHHEEWEELPEDVRLETIRRADRGVFSQGVVAKLSQDSRVRHFCVDVQKIEVGEGSTGLLRIIGKKHKNRDKNQIIPCQLLIFAMGFDSLFFAEMIKDDQLSKTLRKRVKGMYAIERQIGDDLSVSASISPSKLYLPALAGLARGPGFPNLSCLGVLSDRILGRSPKTPAAPRSTITPKPRSR